MAQNRKQNKKHDYDYFISYTQKDEQWAEWVAWQLKSRNNKVFLQAWHFRPGQDFIELMQKGIEKSQHVIAIISPDYFNSAYATAEWKAVFSDDPTGMERRLIPVRISEFKPPKTFKTRIYIDLAGVDDSDEAIGKLLNGLRPDGTPKKEPAFPGGSKTGALQEEPTFPPVLTQDKTKPSFVSEANYEALNYQLAVENISTRGDTDVFPFPFETYLFYDFSDSVIRLLADIDKDFNSAFENYPPYNDTSLTVVGHYGFRWATQIDPIWNAYLLAQVLALGPKIEKSRIPLDEGIVYSYRLKYDEQSKYIFSRDIGWIDFQRRSVEHAIKPDFKYMVMCDISDFYARIDHEKLRYALEQIAPESQEACQKIITILNHISVHQSYGLPIGGPSARLLSELLLDRIDRHLVNQEITFCRYADDYRILVPDKEAAYEALVLLSEKLFNHAGLSLQKSKTQMMTTEEYLNTSEFAASKKPKDSHEASVRRFLSIRLHYDPYSPTANEDWEELRSRLDEFDILEMLYSETRKTRIHPAAARRIVSAVRFLEPSVRDRAIITVLDNMQVLYPVLPSVFLMLKGLLVDLNEEILQKVFELIRDLVKKKSFLIRTSANLSYAVRILAHDLSPYAERILASLFKSVSSSMIKRDIILAMANRRATYWLDDLRVRYIDLNKWERRALLVASVVQGNDGLKWRGSLERQLSNFDRLAIRWAEEKIKNENWTFPL